MRKEASTWPGPCPKGRPAQPPKTQRSVLRLFAGFLMLGALFGCGGGGLIPGGPHSIDSLALQRLIRSQAMASRISPKLVSAVITIESHGDPSAISSTGAAGLMQLMPETAAFYGVGNRFDPESNISGGCHYLRDLLARYHNNVSLALAAYNAGPGAVDASHGIPPYPETRAYVARVTAALRNQTL